MGRNENPRGVFWTRLSISSKWPAQENDPKIKAELERQAASYRNLAEKRAKEYGLKMPNKEGASD
jgi:hypothetical protein